MKKVFLYGMRLRGFSPGCQPMKGLVATGDDAHGRFYDLLGYDRELTQNEVESYELTALGVVRMMEG